MNFIQSAAQGMQTYELEQEKDLPLKHSLPIYIQHRLGDVSIQGWVQDRVRVSMKLKVIAENEADAKLQFQKLDLITLQTRKEFELRVGHSHGVDLVTKMRDQTTNNVVVDLEIKAPYLNALTLVMGEGKTASVTEWRGPINLSGAKNSLHLARLNLNKPLQVNCVDCEMDLIDSKCQGNINVGNKVAFFNRVEANPVIAVEETNDEVRLDHAKGKFQVSTKAGRLNISSLDGQIQFHSDDGGAFVNHLNGAASIQTRTGQVMIDQEDPRSTINIDTDKGDVQISLPPAYEGELDLMSLKGEVVVQFPYEPKKNQGFDQMGPASPGRVEGFIGTNADAIIHAYSKQGGVRLLRKSRTSK